MPREFSRILETCQVEAPEPGHERDHHVGEHRHLEQAHVPGGHEAEPVRRLTEQEARGDAERESRADLGGEARGAQALAPGSLASGGFPSFAMGFIPRPTRTCVSDHADRHESFPLGRVEESAPRVAS